MSAQMKTFFELKKVTDHDCGNYRIGEIDFVNYEALKDHVKKYGENGYKDLAWVLTKCLGESQKAILVYRARLSAKNDSCCFSLPSSPVGSKINHK